MNTQKDLDRAIAWKRECLIFYGKVMLEHPSNQRLVGYAERDLRLSVKGIKIITRILEAV